MPVASVTLEDTNRSILSQAYFRIIKDIVSTIKIPHSTLIAVQKDTEVTLTDNRSNATTGQPNNLPSTVADRRVVATITEDYNEDELTTTAVHQQNASPIFLDPDISVSVCPIYVKSDITIEFSYISPSKTEATRLRDDIRLRLSQMRNIDIHELEYAVLIPEVVEDFIADVHELKSRLVPMSLQEYFHAHSTNRIYPITDVGNQTNTKLAVQEKQVRIIGLFDFSSMPEKLEIDNETNTYRITFAYKLSMDVPRAMAMHYPVMVCNRPMPTKYLQHIEDKRIHSKEERKKTLGYTQSLYALSHFEAHRQLEDRIDIALPINVPLFDEFYCRQYHRGYAIVASFLTQVSEVDNKSLFNLKEIDPVHIPQVLLDYLQAGERRYIVTPYASMLYLGLHQEGTHFDNPNLVVDENFNVSSKTELTLYKPVRVTLSICIDLSYLSPNAIPRHRLTPEVYAILLSESIRATNNYKTEFSRDYQEDNTLYRELIYLINEYLTRDQTENLYRILDVIAEDSYTSIVVGRLLTRAYPDLCKRLLSLAALTINPVTGEIISLRGTPPAKTIPTPRLNPDPDLARNYRDQTEMPIMKTVMHNQVTAYRQE